MRQSRLPAGGINPFQVVKAKREEIRAKGQKKIIDLSIGQPAGPAFLSARAIAATGILSDQEVWHEYADNGCPAIPDFAARFVDGHLQNPLKSGVDYMPAPGSKSELACIVQLACGADLKVVATTTNPGYPTPKICTKYLGLGVFEPTTNPANKFLFDPQELQASAGLGLVMTNYPHNPSGAVAIREWIRYLCNFCQKYGIRFFNDAAYAALAYGQDSFCLADVAQDYPDLSWAEVYSASKLIGNGTGWRVAAVVGSPDFVGDIKTINGNFNSGFNSALAAGALYALEHDKQSIRDVTTLYKGRALQLYRILYDAGMKPALSPRAGFFTLWEAPKVAFGKKMEDAADFALAMAENCGDVAIIGVPFHPYIRYAVAREDISAVAEEIKAAFAKAQVGY